MFPEPQRCLQPCSFAQVQHSTKLPLHGAIAQLRTRAEAGRVFPEPPAPHGTAASGPEEPWQ